MFNAVAIFTLPVILDVVKRNVFVENICLVNIINTNINKKYVDSKQAFPYCQSVILSVRLFSTVTQTATYS